MNYVQKWPKTISNIVSICKLYLNLILDVAMSIPLDYPSVGFYSEFNGFKYVRII